MIDSGMTRRLEQERQGGHDQRSAGVAQEPQTAAEPHHAGPHAGDADPEQGAALGRLPDAAGQPAAIVENPQFQGIGPDPLGR